MNVDGVSLYRLTRDVVNAACELRDFPYEDDPSGKLEALDVAVDRYRKKLLEGAVKGGDSR